MIHNTFVALSEIDIEKLKKEQESIAKKAIIKDCLPSKVKTIGGFDVAYMEEKASVSGLVMNFENFDIVDSVNFKASVKFPYVPTFLYYREGRLIIKAYRKLKIKPEVIFLNGHGIAHPLKAGLATHVGVLLNKPTIGVAKRKLVGEIGNFENDVAPLFFEGKQVGWILKRKDASIYISPGHMISVEKALEMVMKSIKNNLPEPLRIAHQNARLNISEYKNKNYLSKFALFL